MIKRIAISAGITVLTLFAAILLLPPQAQTPDVVNQNGSKLRICPEAWYENRMPVVGGDPNVGYPQYFVVEGERVEVEEMDVEWVVENCDIKSPMPVY